MSSNAARQLTCREYKNMFISDKKIYTKILRSSSSVADNKRIL